MHTHYIPLTKRDALFHTVLRSVIGSIFIVFCLLFIKELLFPSHTFNFLARIDSLANTISRPYVTQYGTGFDIATFGDFTHATISFSLSEGSAPLPRDTKILAQKSFMAFLSPISAKKYTAHKTETYEIDEVYYLKEQDTLFPLVSENAFSSYIFNQNTAITEDDLEAFPFSRSSDVRGFASGTLISSEEGVFVIDGEAKHPFQDENAVIALGYDFENVRPATSEERSLHKKARMFTIGSTHPFGTIFYAQDSDHMYVYDNDQLHKITPTPKARKHAIDVAEGSRTTFSSCKLKPHSFLKKRYSCMIPIDRIKNFPGNIYQFHITAPGVDIAQAQVTLTKNVTKKSLELRIQELKREFAKQYLQ